MANVIGVPALFSNFWHLRARTDQAHLASEDVDHLRKLVEAQLTEATTEAGVARVVVALVPVAAFLVAWKFDDPLTAIRTHSAELVDGEELAVFANALLFVQHGLSKADTNCGTDGRCERSCSDCGGRAYDEVEWPLATAFVERPITDDSKVITGGSASVQIRYGRLTDLLIFRDGSMW